MTKTVISKFIFLPGQLNQWKKFESDKFIFWIAGINKKQKCLKIEKILSEDFGKIEKKKIFEILGNHFGLIVFSSKWIFAISDFARSYPIFWKLDNNKLFLSPQGNLLKIKEDKVNHKQLQAFRMSGYTTND